MVQPRSERWCVDCEDVYGNVRGMGDGGLCVVDEEDAVRGEDAEKGVWEGVGGVGGQGEVEDDSWRVLSGGDTILSLLRPA